MESTLQGDRPRYARGLTEVGPGLWAWLQPNGSWGEANAGLIAGDGASAVVDTLWDERLAAEMLGAIGPHVAEAPIELVVNTHSDGDHWWGNRLMPPEAEIVTSRASLETMRGESPAALSRQRRLAGLAGRIPGRPGAMGRYVAAMLAPYDFDGVRTRLPDRAFSGTATETVGGRELRLVEVGPAHSAGDLIVHVPDAGVVFTADILFVGATPVIWAGPLRNWIAALDTLLALDADTYVPGHGPVCGRAEAEVVREYWTWLEASAAGHHAAGRGPLETARAMVAEPGFAPFRDWLSPERIAINVTTYQRELAGDGPIPATPVARARLFDGVAALGRELARG